MTRILKLPLAVLQPGLLARLAPTDSRYSIEMVLSNCGLGDRHVGVLGTILEPDDPAYQRLFVAGCHGRMSIVPIGTGQRRTIRLATVCMDEDLRDPEPRVGYRVSGQDPPRELVEAARRWERKRPRVGDADWMLPRQDFMTLKEVERISHGKAVLS